MIADIIIVVFLLYLAFGAWLFNEGLKEIGGKEGYLKYLAEEVRTPHPYAAFFIGVLAFLLAWPIFIRRK